MLSEDAAIVNFSHWFGPVVDRTYDRLHSKTTSTLTISPLRQSFQNVTGNTENTLNKKGRVEIVAQTNCISCVTVAVHCAFVSRPSLRRLHNTCKHIYNASMISPILNTEAPIKRPSEPPISANICDLCEINIGK